MPISLPELVVLALATWRVSSLLTQEDGPFYMFAAFRHGIGVDRPGEMPGIAVLFSCVWCMSIWVAPVLALLLLSTIGLIVLALFAASTVAIVVQKIVQPGP